MLNRASAHMQVETEPKKSIKSQNKTHTAMPGNVSSTKVHQGERGFDALIVSPLIENK